MPSLAGVTCLKDGGVQPPALGRTRVALCLCMCAMSPSRSGKPADTRSVLSGTILNYLGFPCPGLWLCDRNPEPACSVVECSPPPIYSGGDFISFWTLEHPFSRLSTLPIALTRLSSLRSCYIFPENVKKSGLPFVGAFFS